jgi:hypothetical protein
MLLFLSMPGEFATVIDARIYTYAIIVRGIYRLTFRRGATQISYFIQAQHLQVTFLVIFKSVESLIFVGFFLI